MCRHPFFSFLRASHYSRIGRVFACRKPVTESWPLFELFGRFCCHIDFCNNEVADIVKRSCDDFLRTSSNASERNEDGKITNALHQEYYGTLNNAQAYLSVVLTRSLKISQQRRFALFVHWRTMKNTRKYVHLITSAGADIRAFTQRTLHIH